MTASLSVIVITKNEAQCIRRCLDSVRWADEIVVVDSGSTDETVAIAQQYTPNVLVTDWPGFGKQKNRALAQATCDWVLSIDADEWVSEALQQEIVTVVNDQTAQRWDAFWLPRRTKYLGEWVDYGDVGRDRVVRLFKRGCAKFTDEIVHESLQVDSGQIGLLRHKLLHESYRSVEALLERMNHYTTLSAKIRLENGKSSSLTKAILHGCWAFVKAYFWRMGFLDGRIGFVVAISSAESSYYRYLKLWWLQKKEEPKNL
jgi:glycosyltransferase involved in cell wall biosynthesis